MRYLLLLLAAVGLISAAAPRDWSTVARLAPDGAYVIGNPAAKVKLVEYLSYTCPHCAEFTAESAPTLRAKLVRSGSTSIEVRHAIREKLDLAAALLARCAGPAGFVRLNDAIFAQQGVWYPRGADYAETNDARLNIYPELARLRAYADGSGLSDLARQQGMSAAALDRCFATDADLKRVTAMAAQAWGTIKGTPSFQINNRDVAPGNWASIEPQLRAAGAR